jgi:hypothetical protein
VLSTERPKRVDSASTPAGRALFRCVSQSGYTRANNLRAVKGRNRPNLFSQGELSPSSATSRDQNEYSAACIYLLYNAGKLFIATQNFRNTDF